MKKISISEYLSAVVYPDILLYPYQQNIIKLLDKGLINQSKEPSRIQRMQWREKLMRMKMIWLLGESTQMISPDWNPLPQTKPFIIYDEFDLII